MEKAIFTERLITPCLSIDRSTQCSDPSKINNNRSVQCIATFNYIFVFPVPIIFSTKQLLGHIMHLTLNDINTIPFKL